MNFHIEQLTRPIALVDLPHVYLPEQINILNAMIAKTDIQGIPTGVCLKMGKFEIIAHADYADIWLSISNLGQFYKHHVRIKRLKDLKMTYEEAIEALTLLQQFDSTNKSLVQHNELCKTIKEIDFQKIRIDNENGTTFGRFHATSGKCCLRKTNYIFICEMTKPGLNTICIYVNERSIKSLNMSHADVADALRCLSQKFSYKIEFI